MYSHFESYVHGVSETSDHFLPIAFRINGSISSFRIKSYSPWYDIKAPVNERIQKDGDV